MSYILNNSRDIGNKFLFGNFMMRQTMDMELPWPGKIELIAEKNESNLRVSQMMMLKNKIAICAYDNASRKNSYIYTVTLDSNHTIEKVYDSGPDWPLNNHRDTKRETIGMSYNTIAYNNKKVYVLPSKDGGEELGYVLYIDYDTGEVGNLSFVAPCQYSEVAIDGVAYFVDKDRTSDDRGFYNTTTGEKVKGKDSLTPPPAIVFGMVKPKNDSSNYICACDDYGLYKTNGWRNTAYISDVNYAGDKLLAFYRNGKVHVIDEATGQNIKDHPICNTGLKARRSCQDESRKVCYWTTYGPQQLWVTNGKRARKLADFGGEIIEYPEEEGAQSEGSAFSSSVCKEEENSKVVYVAITKAGNTGWALYKVNLLWGGKSTVYSGGGNVDPGGGGYIPSDDYEPDLPGDDPTLNPEYWQNFPDGSVVQAYSRETTNIDLSNYLTSNVNSLSVTYKNVAEPLYFPAPTYSFDNSIKTLTISPTRAGLYKFILVANGNSAKPANLYIAVYDKYSNDKAMINWTLPAVWGQEPWDGVFHKDSMRACDYNIPMCDMFARMDAVNSFGGRYPRTWRTFHWVDFFKLNEMSDTQLINMITTEMATGNIKGYCVDFEGDWTISMMNRLKNACNQAGNVKLVGAFNPKGPYGDSSLISWVSNVTYASLIFKYDITWNAYKDEYIDGIWRAHGYSKQMGIFQDQFRNTGSAQGASLWYNNANGAFNTGYVFALFHPEGPSVSKGNALRAELLSRVYGIDQYTAWEKPADWHATY